MRLINLNVLDFDIVCFSESQLDANITSESQIVSSKYDIPYRKIRTNHSGGLFIYLSCELTYTRIIGLETFWNESQYMVSVCLIVHREQTRFSLILSTTI